MEQRIPEKIPGAAEVLQKRRDGVRESWKLIPEMPRSIVAEKVSEMGAVGEWHHNLLKNTGETRVLYCVFGEDFATGSPDAGRWFAAELSDALSMDAFVTCCRQWPEASHPAALADCGSGFEYVLGKGYAQSDVLLFGEGAGADLLLCFLLWSRDHEMTIPGRVSVLSPLISAKEKLPKYFAEKDRTDPYAFAELDDYTAFPALQVLGSRKDFSGDAGKLQALAEKAQVPVTVRAFDGTGAELIRTPGKESREAVNEIAAFFRGEEDGQTDHDV